MLKNLQFYARPSQFSNNFLLHGVSFGIRQTGSGETAKYRAW